LADAGPFTFVAAAALMMKIREAGRVINAVVLVARGLTGGTPSRQRRANRPGRGHHGQAARPDLATLPHHPLRRQPHDHVPQGVLARGQDDAATSTAPAGAFTRFPQEIWR
jgi:hypothetical protein